MIKVDVDMKAIRNVERFCRAYPQALTASLDEAELVITLQIQHTSITWNARRR